MGKEALYLQRATAGRKRPAAPPAGRLADSCMCGIRGPVENKRFKFSRPPLKSISGTGSRPHPNPSGTIFSADPEFASCDFPRSECSLSESLGGSTKVVARQADKELVRALCL